ncbi:hydroxylamine reductase [Limisalsivibrio acetivorans]|uniref:hydroxylamine reductase n=1 Tax=Limisalsivibrio acetivorans TaxID=1304888 RepID=UPI0003B79178|nr:hydroxylamine reductase [Limisalsivibrio acetivorans]
MGMFCYQCQETAKNEGCTVRGVCGKPDDAANLMDLLVYVLKGAAFAGKHAPEGKFEKEMGRFTFEALFSTITNANFDKARITSLIDEAIERRDALAKEADLPANLPDCVTWKPSSPEEYDSKGASVGVLNTEHEDIRSLRELLTYGLKGIAAYGDHAAVLGFEDESIYSFAKDALAAAAVSNDADELLGLVMKCGENAVNTMALLDKANTNTYGKPEPTKVDIGVRNNPGILISGHDLKDLQELLEQTEGTGVDVYTHSEMLPGHYYPAFKKYDHFAGNYGGSWWKQDKEFASFNGPILMTTNCIVPVKDDYRERIFTTGMAGYPGVKHVPNREAGKQKDFSEIIELAKTCNAPEEIETGSVTGGFAHDYVESIAGTVVDAVKAGAVKGFVVMAGCDGRHKTREHYTDVAKNLPEGFIILTAGCAKYRYNKLDLGEIGGIPRVLDAGQCNDSYSLAVTALKLKEAFGLEDINELPIYYDVAWYEQKAVTVLLALLALGVKNINLGPTLPAFLSPNVANIIVDKFELKPMDSVEGFVNSLSA